MGGGGAEGRDGRSRKEVTENLGQQPFANMYLFQWTNNLNHTLLAPYR